MNWLMINEKVKLPVRKTEPTVKKEESTATHEKPSTKKEKPSMQKEKSAVKPKQPKAKPAALPIPKAPEPQSRTPAEVGGSIHILWDLTTTLEALRPNTENRTANFIVVSNLIKGIVDKIKMWYNLDILNPETSKSFSLRCILDASKAGEDFELYQQELRALSLFGGYVTLSDGKSEGDERIMEEWITEAWDDPSSPPSVVVIISGRPSVIGSLSSNKGRYGGKAKVVVIGPDDEFAERYNDRFNICDVSMSIRCAVRQRGEETPSVAIRAPPRAPTDLIKVGVFLDASNVLFQSHISGDRAVAFDTAVKALQVKLTHDLKLKNPFSCYDCTESLHVGYTNAGRAEYRLTQTEKTYLTQNMGYSLNEGDGGRGGDDRFLIRRIHKFLREGSAEVAGAALPRLLILFTGDQDFTHVLRQNRWSLSRHPNFVVLVRNSKSEADLYRNRLDVCDEAYSMEELLSS